MEGGGGPMIEAEIAGAGGGWVEEHTRSEQDEPMQHVARGVALVALVVGGMLGGCRSAPRVEPLAGDGRLLGRLYESQGYQLTGVAVSRGGRLLVNFPRWSDAPGTYRMAVGEIGRDNAIRPYPDAEWNRFSADPRTPPEGDRFVCVQSVHIDGRDRLWVLDPASPLLGGVIRGPGRGPKLVQIDLASNRVARVIRFDEQLAPERSYLNDVRIELGERGDTAYITDSGLGAIVVVDLASGRARRLLADHPSTKADAAFVPVIGGRELRARQDGHVPQIHADGLAIDARPESAGGGYLYWQALTGRRLWRAPLRVLRDPSMTAEQVGAAVQDMGETVMTDGMECDADGVLFFTALEKDAIVVRLPDGSLHSLVSDPAIAWPDSMTLGYGRMPGSRRNEPLVVFTTAQIHRSPLLSEDGSSPAEPYRVLVTPAPRRKR